jgi:hypothetical protein
MCLLLTLMQVLSTLFDSSLYLFNQKPGSWLLFSSTKPMDALQVEGTQRTNCIDYLEW